MQEHTGQNSSLLYSSQSATFPDLFDTTTTQNASFLPPSRSNHGYWNGTISNFTEGFIDGTNGTLADEPVQSLLEKVLIYTIFGSISLLGVLFNIITIIVFTRGKRSSVRDIRILILNLAAVDIIYAISGPIPVALEITHVSFVNNIAVCKLYRFVYILSAYGSPLANLGIAIERLIILFSPARTLRLRNRQTVMAIIIGSLWAFNFVITAEYMVSPILEFFDGEAFCVSNTYLNRKFPKIFNWLLVVKFCVPSLLIMIIYAIIGIKLTMCGPVRTISLDAHLRKQSKARNQVSWTKVGHTTIGIVINM